jgi:Co/Zn/Cd efflux system component
VTLFEVNYYHAVMFVVEGWAGLLAHATSLLADALDMLGDALVYGFSLFVLARSAR